MAQRAKTSRPQVGLRVSEDMRARLEKAAKKSGCSINAEIVARLERSFETESRFGGPRATALVEAMGQAMMAAGTGGYHEFGKIILGQEWLDLPIPFDRAVAAALKILEHNRPSIDRIILRIEGAKELNEAIQRVKADLAELFALLETRGREETK